ncbi:ABC transporter ATP-binding protein [Microbacterium sp. AGC85]
MSGNRSEPEATERETALVVVNDLTTEIDTARGVVRPIDGVSLSIKAGETFGLVGETGSGKSLLIRSIMGLLPAGGKILPESSVVFEGVDLTTLNARKLRSYWGRSIAMIPQDPATSLNPVRKIGDQISDSLRRRLGMSRKEAWTQAADLLDQVGIASARSRLSLYPHEMSGGMRQRVLIAIAISMKPKLLVADEPTTALDVTIQRQILDLITALKEENGMSVILVSHDLSLVSGHSDTVAVMYGGKLVETMPSADLGARDRHPYTVGLLASHPDITAPSGLDLPTIPGEPPDILRRPSGCPFRERCGNAQSVCAERMPALVPDGDTSGHLLACHNPMPASGAAHHTVPERTRV